MAPASRDRSAPGRRSPARRRGAARWRSSADMSPRARRSGSVRIAAGVDRLLDREDRGQRLVRRGARARRRVCAASSVSPSTHATGWRWNITSRGKSGSSWRAAPRVALARHVGARQHRDDARLVERRGDVERGEPRVRVRRQHRPGVQQAGKAPGQVVGVERLAGDVAARALVRHRPARRSSCARPSHQNFSTRLLGHLQPVLRRSAWSLIGVSVRSRTRLHALDGRSFHG